MNAAPMLPADSLRGKVAIITGGGTGLGKGFAEEFSRLGAKVVIGARRQELIDQAAAEIRAKGGEILAVRTDIRDPAQVQATVDRAVEHFGRVDILVNNAAGIFLCPSEKISPNGWRTVVDTVLNGTFFCSQAVAKHLIANERSGAILNIVAHAAWNGGPGYAHSAAAKAGVVALIKTLAVEWAPYGIRVNGLAPGVFRTAGSQGQVYSTPEEEEFMLKNGPVIPRWGQIIELANAAAYLVSDFGALVTGEVLNVDGGMQLKRPTMKFTKD